MYLLVYTFERMSRFLFICLLFLPLIAFSQRPENAGAPSAKGVTGAITGVLLDSISRDAVAFASVGVIDRQSGKTINGGISDEKGSFKINGLSAGAYTLQIVFMGYKIKEVNDISLSPQKPDFDCRVILLAPETRLLEEIQIVGEAALIEARPDKIVYNAEKDVNTRGGDAADVLRNVPLLSVDFDGNVTLRGSENIRILINGRPSGIFNASIADALKMMPADQIKSVEVITAPSAKYDGEGTAGIINIITKKKNIEGFAGSVDLTAGNRSDRGNMNFNYGRGRLGLNMSGGGHYSPPLEGTTSFRREDFSGALPTFLTQDGTNTSSRLGYRLNLAAEYNINAFSTLNSGFSYRGHNVDNLNDVLSTFSIDTMVQELFRRTTDGYSNRGGWDWEMDYRRTFPKKDKEWSIAFELDKDDDHSASLFDLGYAYPLTQPDALESNENFGNNIELTMQTDYTHPFNSAVKFESGLKATLRIIESDFIFSQYNADFNEWVTDPKRTDIFYYDQNVYAGYVNGNFNLGDDMTLITGLRLEITELLGEFENYVSPFENTYANLLPNVTLSKKVGEYNQVKISYNQRIQRPNQRHINPFVEFNDERDIAFGNPKLGPELVQQVELGTNVFIKGNMVNLSIFGRRTEDLIESLLTITPEGVSQTTFENFGVRSAIGLNAFGSLALGEKITLKGGFDINLWTVDGSFEGEDLSNRGIDYNCRLTLTWTITETLKAEAFSMFKSPVYTVQGKLPNWVMSTFAIKQELFKKKLVIGINIFQPFTESRAFERELSGDTFYQNNTTIRPMRSIGINLGYRFGKLDTKQRSGKKKINNTDLKEDSGNDSQF